MFDTTDGLFGFFVAQGNDVNADGVRDLIAHAGIRDAAGAIAATREANRRSLPLTIFTCVNSETANLSAWPDRPGAVSRASAPRGNRRRSGSHG